MTGLARYTRRELFEQADALRCFYMVEGRHGAAQFFVGMMMELQGAPAEAVEASYHAIVEMLTHGRDRLGPCGLA